MEPSRRRRILDNLSQLVVIVASITLVIAAFITGPCDHHYAQATFDLALVILACRVGGLTP